MVERIDKKDFYSYFFDFGKMLDSLFPFVLGLVVATVMGVTIRTDSSNFTEFEILGKVFFLVVYMVIFIYNLFKITSFPLLGAYFVGSVGAIKGWSMAFGVAVLIVLISLSFAIAPSIKEFLDKNSKGVKK